MISGNEIILRLLLGAVLGGIIGFERHAHGRAAGFRTHLLVCVASVLIMIVSEYYHYLSRWDPSYIRIDPARLAAGAITGVGFLGAGVIVKTGLNVQGLTTAACLWIVSAIGLSIGSGLYTAGAVSFLITFLALWLLRIVEDRMPSLSYRVLTVVMEGRGDEEAVAGIIEKCGGNMSRTDYEYDRRLDESTHTVTISFRDPYCPRAILEGVSALSPVRKITIRD